MHIYKCLFIWIEFIIFIHIFIYSFLIFEILMIMLFVRCWISIYREIKARFAGSLICLISFELCMTIRINQSLTAHNSIEIDSEIFQVEIQLNCHATFCQFNALKIGIAT